MAAQLSCQRQVLSRQLSVFSKDEGREGSRPFCFWTIGVRISHVPIDPIFERVFQKLYGMPCWGVEYRVGSGIVLEFGDPHLVIREPSTARPKASRRVRELFAKRGVTVRGQWRLWIWMCNWEIFHKGKRLGGDQARSNLQPIVHSLDGQNLIRFSIGSRRHRYVFEFDLGGVLVTHPWGPDDDQWMLFEPSGFVLTARGNNKFSYHRSNQPLDAGPWKPIFVRTE